MSVMTPQSPPELSQPPEEQARRPEYVTPEVMQTPLRKRLSDHRFAIGTILVLLGLVMLIESITSWSVLGLLILPTLGLAFTIWGCASRRAGLIIPGGILLGLGVGALLMDRGFAQASGAAQGAVVTLCLALGFAVITPLTWAFTRHMHWWPLIPGGVLAIAGISLIGGEWGAQALVWLGRLWPIVLILAGAILLWQVMRKH
jgi:hypothetical protein